MGLWGLMGVSHDGTNLSSILYRMFCIGMNMERYKSEAGGSLILLYIVFAYSTSGKVFATYRCPSCIYWSLDGNEALDRPSLL